MSQTTPLRKLKQRNYIAYGLGDLYGGGSFFLISTFSMYFLVSIIGMDPILAGLIPGLGKVWDAVSDPIMGYLTDTNRSRHGRRRVFFLIGLVPIAITFALIWIPVGFTSQWALFVYYFAAYLCFYSCSTMVLIPYSALSAEMTTDFTERNRLTGTRMVFSMTATLIGGLAAQPLVNAFPTQTQGHLVMGLVFGVFFAIPYIFVFLGTWEVRQEQTSVAQRISIFSNFRSILGNRSFRIHIAMYICAYAAMDVLMAWFKFYVMDYLGKPGMVTVGLGTLLVTQMVALPLYVRLSNKKGHAFAYRMGLAIWACAIVAMVFQRPDGSMVALVVNCFFIGAGMSAGVMVPFQLLPFVADVDELMTGTKRAGTYAGAMTLVRKLIQGALVLPLLGLMLKVIGYVATPGSVQAQGTMQSLRLIFVTVPALLAVLGIVASLGFPITPRTHAVLRAELDRRSAGGNPRDMDPETAAICARMTGPR